MPDPFDSNDDWADLARELERNKPPIPPADPAECFVREAEAIQSHRDADSQHEETAPAGNEEEFEAEDAASSEEEVAAGEQPGTGRKRRRRRRRRRKSGSPEGTPVLAGDAPSEFAETSEGESDSPVGEEYAESESFNSDDAEADPVSFSDEDEDTASEVLRELIANWNVPSWDEIVGGLHRPGH